ncbi:MAG: Jag N-terminal domain-containing protein [Deltaproteobacteria bacterium]|nr:Jag N-terminal domain-containing protein [Deltaproteobacteria bacterium]
MIDMEFEGRNEREAVLRACAELKISEDQLDYSVIDEGSAGLLGFGARPARIRAKQQAETKPVVAETPKAAERADEDEEAGGRVGPAPEKAAKALEVARALVEKMGVKAEVSVRDEHKEIVLTIAEVEGGTDVASILGGSRPPAAPSLQFLLNKIVNRFPDDRKHIVVETPSVERAPRPPRRHDQRPPRPPRAEGNAPTAPLEEVDPELAAIGRLLGERARTLKKVISIQIMSPADRRGIHQTLKDMEGVETASEGDGIYRQMYVVPRSGEGPRVGGSEGRNADPGQGNNAGGRGRRRRRRRGGKRFEGSSERTDPPETPPTSSSE